MHAVLLVICLSLFSGLALATKPNSAENLAESQKHLRQGQYFQAIKALELAVQEANTPDQKAYATGALGLIHYQLHHDSEAEDLLRTALALKTGNHHEQARWNTQLGILMMNQKKTDEAKQLFATALRLADNDQELTSGIELQKIELLPLNERLPKLNQIQKRLSLLKPSEVRSNYLVRLATQARRAGTEGQKLAYESLVEAKKAAPPRLLAEILGEIAQLYEEERRYVEAFQLNQDALEAINSVEAAELFLELEWRKGRLHRLLKQIPEAIAAYQRAIEHIETIRHDIPMAYRDGRSSFRTTLEPLYQQMADLLLQQANPLTDVEKMPLLRRARNVIELVKQAELEDFLGGRCAIQPVRSALLEAVEPQTAILYPIMLPDRLEILVSTGNEIQQFTQAINAKTLQNTVHKFVGALRSGQPNVKEFSSPLYEWLIAPLENYLQKNHVQTLVVVPDSVLRLLPFSALYDGKGYLIERFAVSTSPGLSIIEPVPLHPHQVKSLIVGLSKPGNVIDHLPTAIINEIDISDSRGLSPNNHARSRALPFPNNADLINGVNTTSGQQTNLQDQQIRQKIEEALSLPGVVAEIDNLRPTISAKVLLNEGFNVESFRQELLSEPYAIVHIASHLITGSNAASSFIMAYDDVINFDQLDGLLRSGKFASQPVEMLTLSACQTAEGDDRSPLGLSGLAVKAKVRSALGTLWPANDEAAALLMVEFYKALNQPNMSKAQALRRAQMSLLTQKKMEHPFFWGAYILVGNWL